MEIKVIADKWMMPERQHQDDAGADLKADATWRIEPGRTRMVGTMSDGAHDAMSLIVNILMAVMMLGGLICRDTCVVAYAGFILVILAIESIGREIRR